MRLHVVGVRGADVLNLGLALARLPAGAAALVRQLAVGAISLHPAAVVVLRVADRYAAEVAAQLTATSAFVVVASFLGVARSVRAVVDLPMLGLGVRAVAVIATVACVTMSHGRGDVNGENREKRSRANQQSGETHGCVKMDCLKCVISTTSRQKLQQGNPVVHVKVSFEGNSPADRCDGHPLRII
jgi:hypothetical protein